MDWKRSRKAFLIGLLILAALVLTSCSSESLSKLWVKSEGWSRGLLLGQTSMAAPADLVMDQSGTLYSVLFPRAEDGQDLYRPELVSLNSTGEVITHYPIDLRLNLPRESKIFLTAAGLDLFWIDDYQLKVIQVSLSGDLLSPVQVLSGEHFVNNFEVIPWNEEYLIWYAGRRDDPGLYALSGSLSSLQETLIDPLGIRVQLFLDRQGQLHSCWARYPVSYGTVEFYYLTSDPKDGPGSEPIQIWSKAVTPAIRIDGPAFAIDSEIGYLIWSEVVLTGIDAGQQVSYYRYFPLDHPDRFRPSMGIAVPALQNLPMEAFPGGYFQTGDRIPVYPGIPSNPFLENLETLTGQFSEAPIVIRYRSEFKWRDFRNQVGIIYLSDGLLTSFQPLSYTSAESYYPTVFRDDGDNLYVAWLEKGETTFRLYLTTTEPTRKVAIDQVSREDYVYLAAEGFFGLLAGIVLAPFAAAAWGGVSLLAFLFQIILSRFHKPIYRTWGEILSIAGGIGIFWAFKLATLPGLKDGYVPFSAWIPRIPPQIQQPLVIGVPILIGLTAFGTAWFNTYGKKAGSAINFHMIYAAVDAALSCAVYGILIYGSF